MRVPVSEIALDTAGRAVDGARFAVVDRLTGLNATLWSDATTGTTAANPIVTVNGRADAWVYPGPIRIDVSDSIVPTRFSAYTQYRELLPAQVITARVIMNTTIYIPNATLTSFSGWTVESYDTDNMWASGQPSRLYANTPGRYLVESGIAWASAPNGTTGGRAISLRPNTTNPRLGGQRTNANNVSLEATYVAASTIATLSVSGFMEVNVYQSAGATIGTTITDGGLGAESFFQMTWLGR